MNRAERIWYNWEEKQQRLERVQGIEKEALTAIQRYRYDYLKHGLYRLGRNPDPEEKMFAQIIRSTIAKIRRELHPNPFIRAIVGIKEFFYDRPLHVRRFLREQERSCQLLKEQFREKGISVSLRELEKIVGTEAEKVKLEFGTQLNSGKEMYLEMSFHNKSPGSFILEQYSLSLIEDGGRGKRSCSFRSDSNITVNEAINLLQGRAIKKAFDDVAGSVAYKWLQADLSTYDEKDNVKIREFRHDFSFDLKNVLTEFSRDVGVSDLAAATVVKTLELGNQMKFKARDNETYLLHADPLKQSLGLQDGNGNVIDTVKFLEKMNDLQKPAISTQFSLIRTIGVKKENYQSTNMAKEM